MLCKIVSHEEEIPFGALISVSLDKLTADENYWIDVKWNGKNHKVFICSAAICQAETVEESLWIYENYQKILGQDKLLMLNIDPVIRGIGVKEEEDYYYGCWLTKGESFNGTEQVDDHRVLVYNLFLQMLEEEAKDFMEIRVETLGDCLVYRYYVHADGVAYPTEKYIKTTENAEVMLNFVDSFLK